MIGISATLLTYFGSRTIFYMADLITITPLWGLSGASLYYTTAGRTIYTGLGGTPGPWVPFPIERSKIKISRGIQVGELELICYPRTNNRLSTVTIAVAGADYAVGDVLPVVQAGAVGGSVRVTTIDGSGGVTGIAIHHKGYFYSIENSVPTIIDTSGEVAGVSDTSIFFSESLNRFPGNYFNDGIIRFMSGSNVGEVREILTFDPESVPPAPENDARVVLKTALPNLPVAGDRFVIQSDSAYGGGCTVNITAIEEDYINGVPWMTAAAINGQLDGAMVTVQRAFFDAPTDINPIGTWPDGVIPRFVGKVSDSDFSAVTAVLKAKSLSEMLNRSWPRNLYQPGCLLNLYGTDCGAVKATFTESDTAEAGSTDRVINCSSLGTFDDDYFTWGVIEFTSGANSGYRRTVKSFTQAGGVITVAYGFPYTPSVGDGFDIYPGCDKTWETCRDKFDNLVKFRGTPFIPEPEKVV